jgi:hypothetical protein
MLILAVPPTAGTAAKEECEIVQPSLVIATIGEVLTQPLAISLSHTG